MKEVIEKIMEYTFLSFLFGFGPNFCTQKKKGIYGKPIHGQLIKVEKNS